MGETISTFKTQSMEVLNRIAFGRTRNSRAEANDNNDKTANRIYQKQVSISKK